jgi:hypothetical protein
MLFIVSLLSVIFQYIFKVSFNAVCGDNWFEMSLRDVTYCWNNTDRIMITVQHVLL